MLFVRRHHGRSEQKDDTHKQNHGHVDHCPGCSETDTYTQNQQKLNESLDVRCFFVVLIPVITTSMLNITNRLNDSRCGDGDSLFRFLRTFLNNVMKGKFFFFSFSLSLLAFLFHTHTPLSHTHTYGLKGSIEVM